MAIINPSFESAGTYPGTAADWLQYVSPAPAASILGTWNVTTNAFTDGVSLIPDTGERGPLLARVTTTIGAGVLSLNVTYTDAVGGAGRVGTVSIPGGSLAGTVREITLQVGDLAPLDVTAVAEAAPHAGPGVVQITLARREELRDALVSGWRLPMGTQGYLAMGTYDIGPDNFVNGAAFPGTDEESPRLIAVNDTPIPSVTLNITYTDRINGAGRVGTVTLPSGVVVGSSRARVVLQTGDFAPIDVTDIDYPGAPGPAGNVAVYGVRSLTWAEGSASTPEASGNTFNEDALSAFDLAVDVTAATYTHGTDYEGFEFGWSGNNGDVLDEFPLAENDATLTVRASFDADPLLTAEFFEDFEDGWKSPNADEVILGSYRVSDNTYTAGTAGPENGGAYPLSAHARARITEAFENRAMNFNVAYDSEAGGGGPYTGTLAIPALAQVGREYTLSPDPTHPQAGQPSFDGPYLLVGAAPITELTPAVIQGRFDIIVDNLPLAAYMNAGVVLDSMDAFTIIPSTGAVNAAVRYEARAVGVPAPTIRVEHVAPPGTATTIVTVVVGATIDVTITLRTNAAGDILATAAEVVTAVNESEAALPYLWAWLPGTGTGTAVVAAFQNLVLTVGGVEAAMFDPAPLVPEAFEDFEEGWSNNEDSIFNLGVEAPSTIGGDPADGMYYAIQDIALFDGATNFGSFQGTGGGGVGVWTDSGAIMPSPPYTEHLALRVATPFVVSAGDPWVNIEFNSIAAGLQGVQVRGTILDGVTAGCSLWVRLGWADVDDVTAVAVATPPAHTFSAGTCAIFGGTPVETFSGAWTLTLT